MRIDKPAAGGWMIARVEGQVVLVAGAVPGERVTILVDRVGRGVAYGHAVAVDEPSPDRRAPFVDPACGGCLYAHIAYERQRTLKSEVIADALARIGRLSWPDAIGVAASPAEGYRMRARLHLRDGRVGFFREGTHDLCGVRATKQLLAETCDAIDELERRLDRGVRGELELSENIGATERVVHLDEDGAGSWPWAEAGRGLPFSGVTRADASSAARTVVVAGDPHVTDELVLDGKPVPLRRHVRAFFQGNRFLFRDLIGHVLGHVEPGASVVDLYAGVGAFAIAAALVRGARVTAVEGDRFGAADLACNAAAAPASVEALHQSVEEFVARRHPSPGVLIVDPPRTGLSKEALSGSIRMRAATLIYVSCDVATLARDVRRIVDAGYQIGSVAAFDLFPNTPHVETVVSLHR